MLDPETPRTRRVSHFQDIVHKDHDVDVTAETFGVAMATVFSMPVFAVAGRKAMLFLRRCECQDSEGVLLARPPAPSGFDGPLALHPNILRSEAVALAALTSALIPMFVFGMWSLFMRIVVGMMDSAPATGSNEQVKGGFID